MTLSFLYISEQVTSTPGHPLAESFYPFFRIFKQNKKFGTIFKKNRYPPVLLGISCPFLSAANRFPAVKTGYLVSKAVAYF